jgi:hypothetical protein
MHDDFLEILQQCPVLVLKVGQLFTMHSTDRRAFRFVPVFRLPCMVAYVKAFTLIFLTACMYKQFYDFVYNLIKMLGKITKLVLYMTKIFCLSC